MFTEEVACVSWNIHRGRGGDGRVDPGRVMDVLETEVCTPDTDVLFLQEADAEAYPHVGALDVARIAAATGLRHVQSTRALRSTEAAHGFLGVVVFLHPRWTIERVHLIDLPGVHPRGAVVVDACSGGQGVRFCNTHLSLSQILRIAQMRTLGQHLKRLTPMPTILGGDFNEWRPWGGLAFSRRILMETYQGPARPTFPVGHPVLPLDRILVNASGRITDFTVLDGAGIRAASDHRPIRGQVSI